MRAVPLPRRRALTLIALSVAVYLAASAAIAVVMAEDTLHTGHRPLHMRQHFASVVASDFKADLQDVSITAADGTPLRAWYVIPERDNGNAVVLMHGVADTREGVSGYGRMFLNRGYRVLLADSRAHGESGGDIATYGVRESDDIARWVKFLHDQPQTSCVYGFGGSMGAALMLQATAATRDLCAVAVEAPFSTFREVAYDRISEQTGLGLWFARTAGRPALEFALAYAHLKYGVDLTLADPQRALRHSRVPSLIIAGTEDTIIQPRHATALAEAAAGETDLWIVKGAGHGGAVSMHPEQFEHRVTGWFARHPKTQAAPVIVGQ